LPELPIVEWPFDGAEKAQWSKIERIRGLIPMFRAGYVFLAPELRNSELHNELLYYPNVKWDDGVDAMAMTLDFWPWFVGQEEVLEARAAEDRLLEEAFGMKVERNAWDEEQFISEFDATGYSRG
jgi:hypothetical protein